MCALSEQFVFGTLYSIKQTPWTNEQRNSEIINFLNILSNFMYVLYTARVSSAEL